MTTVYVVTRGRYDSYEIVEVFATEELAEAFIEQAKQDEDYWLWRNTYQVEVWPVTSEQPH
jgi:hypothetical protein